MEGSQGCRLASVCTQLEEDAGRNGGERRVDNATHLMEAWDCIWSHGALAQARAIQILGAPAPCGPPVNDVSSQAAGTAPLCDMTAQPRGTDSRATVSAPHSCIAVRRAMLYKFVEGYTAKNTAKNRCIALYTDTRCVTTLHSYTALYTIQLYTAIQLYSAIHYTTSTTPLWRGPHAPRSSTRARIAATSDASDATNDICRCARYVESNLTNLI